MDYVIAALVALMLGVLLGALYLVRREYLAVRDELHQAAQDVAQGLPAVMGNLAKGLADELKASLSGAMMGHASALSKQLQGIESDVAVDAAEQQSPLLSLLMGFSPSLRKRLGKNPMAAMAASALLGKVGGLGGGAPPAPAHSGGNGSTGLTVP